jgi:hypothetical protein
MTWGSLKALNLSTRPQTNIHSREVTLCCCWGGIFSQLPSAKTSTLSHLLGFPSMLSLTISIHNRLLVLLHVASPLEEDEDDPRMGDGQRLKTPCWAAGGINPPGSFYYVLYTRPDCPLCIVSLTIICTSIRIQAWYPRLPLVPATHRSV